MKRLVLFTTLLLINQIHAAPYIFSSKPPRTSSYQINAKALCATAQETLSYLNKGAGYDPQVIHGGQVFKLPLERVKKTLVYLCQHQSELNNPAFIESHFDFFRWYPDHEGANPLKPKKALVAHMPKDQVLMTKYYVHEATITNKPSLSHPFALYGIPNDEARLTLEEADAQPNLLRFQYGKQAILKGALNTHQVPVLGYLSRDDLEAALLQGTIVADSGTSRPTLFNVHRSNNIPYDKSRPPYQQERYWFFKAVHGIKGYGKDATHKITVNPEVTFAADLAAFGLGKLLMIQYRDQNGATVTRAGIFADTGGAFEKNGYQIDYLAGSYKGSEAFYQANRHLPDYVNAYFMVVKE